MEEQPRSIAERVTFGIASAILSAIAGLVIYVWISDRHEPAALSVQQREIRQTDGKFYVPFEVTNTGGEKVESVQVIAELKTGDRVLEFGDQQIDFLSKGEKEEGAFVFQRNPRQGQLTVRVASYKVP